MRRLLERGIYSSNYCNWQLKSLLHSGQIVITFRTLLHLGSLITFRPSTDDVISMSERHKCSYLHPLSVVKAQERKKEQ